MFFVFYVLHRVVDHHVLTLQLVFALLVIETVQLLHGLGSLLFFLGYPFGLFLFFLLVTLDLGLVALDGGGQELVAAAVLVLDDVLEVALVLFFLEFKGLFALDPELGELVAALDLRGDRGVADGRDVFVGEGGPKGGAIEGADGINPVLGGHPALETEVVMGSGFSHLSLLLVDPETGHVVVASQFLREFPALVLEQFALDSVEGQTVHQAVDVLVLVEGQGLGVDHQESRF